VSATVGHRKIRAECITDFWVHDVPQPTVRSAQAGPRVSKLHLSWSAQQAGALRSMNLVLLILRLGRVHSLAARGHAGYVLIAHAAAFSAFNQPDPVER
jgi:hypothetical protein